MELFSSFLKNCQNHLYWEPSARLLIAVSSGVDSMVLLDMIQQLPDELRPWYGVVHVNHELRTVSIEEEIFLEKYCQIRGIPYFSRSWKSNQHPETGIEQAARNFRYAFFKEMMEVSQATHLLTAHHADDQLETILMRLVRGGQLESMIGIKNRRPFGIGLLVRPLLEYAKVDLYAYSETRHLDYYEDETNTELTYTRNRYRQKVVPLLKLENNQVLNHFGNFSSDLSDVLFLAHQVVQQKSDQILLKRKINVYEIDRSTLLSFEPETQRQVLKHILLNEVYQSYPVETLRKQIQELLNLITGTRSNAQLDLPGGWIGRRQYQQFFLEKKASTEAIRLQSEVRLFPEEWHSFADGSRVGFFKVEAFADSIFENELHIWLEPKQITLPLMIRHRRPGDRMTIKGMKKGHKKIKDILIDQKVPMKAREEMLVITDSLNEIIWLLKYKESRLSIQRETDKIQYILVYQR